MELSITQRAHYEQGAAWREQSGEDDRECLTPDDCMSEDEVDAAVYAAIDADRPARLDIGSGWASVTACAAREPVR